MPRQPDLCLFSGRSSLLNHCDGLASRHTFAHTRKIPTGKYAANWWRNDRLTVRCWNDSTGGRDLPRNCLLFNQCELHTDEPLLLHQKLHCAGACGRGRCFGCGLFGWAQAKESEQNHIDKDTAIYRYRGDNHDQIAP